MKSIKYSLKSEALWIMIFSLTPLVLGLLVFIFIRLFN
jgi:hypothetical protein